MKNLLYDGKKLSLKLNFKTRSQAEDLSEHRASLNINSSLEQNEELSCFVTVSNLPEPFFQVSTQTSHSLLSELSHVESI